MTQEAKEKLTLEYIAFLMEALEKSDTRYAELMESYQAVGKRLFALKKESSLATADVAAACSSGCDWPVCAVHHPCTKECSPQPANPAAAPVQRHPVTKQSWGAAQGAEPTRDAWELESDFEHRLNAWHEERAALAPQEQAEPSDLESLIYGLTAIKNQKWFTRVEVEAIAAVLTSKADSTEGGKHG